MSFTDIFTDEFLKGFNADISLYTILVVLLVSLLMGLFVYIVYKVKTRKSFYNKDFNNSLLILPVITAAIVLSMQANIVVSLGMVGALSIVRFRNAVKNSMDLVYLFWAISIGIINGAQVYVLSIILSAIVAIVLLFVDLIPYKNNSFLAVLTIDNEAGLDEVNTVIKSYTRAVTIRSQAKTGGKIQCVYELKTKKREDLASALNNNNHILNMNIILNNGDNRLV